MDILALAWCGLIAFAVIMYVLLGGFDLGIGIMSVFIRNAHERDLMVASILPVWDGNQTWLVLGGAALYGAFPLAFSTILPIMYIPIFIMVIALLFRGIAFEFRLKAIKTKFLWEICFFLGSLIAVIAQGFVLGTFVKGFNLTNAAHYQWLNYFSLLCCIGLIFGYVLLGANYLIIKTEGNLQKKCYNISSKVQYLILIAFIAVSIVSPFLDSFIKERWFNPMNMPFLAILPLLTLMFFVMHWRALKKHQEHLPFWCVIGMFLMCYIGFIISSYPYIVPREITYEQAASDSSALAFMLVGALIMLPILLYYTYHAYSVFRGKVTEVIKY